MLERKIAEYFKSLIKIVKQKSKYFQKKYPNDKSIKNAIDAVKRYIKK
jgi:hypothetical protein